MKVLAIAAWALAVCGAALADPCEGKLPSKAGAEFSGQVRYIVDGDGLCVGPNSDPATWIEVRLVDFDAPELSTPEGKRGKAIITDLAMGKDVRCVTTPGRTGRTTTYDRVLASCSIVDHGLSSLLKSAGAPEGGN